MDAIPLGLLDGIGVVGAAVLIVIGFATGRIFTRRQYDEVIHDRDEWRTESRIKDQQIAEKDTQLRHLVEVGKTVEQLVRGLQQEFKR